MLEYSQVQDWESIYLVLKRDQKHNNIFMFGVDIINLFKLNWEKCHITAFLCGEVN